MGVEYRLVQTCAANNKRVSFWGQQTIIRRCNGVAGALVSSRLSLLSISPSTSLLSSSLSAAVSSVRLRSAGSLGARPRLLALTPRSGSASLLRLLAPGLRARRRTAVSARLLACKE